MDYVGKYKIKLDDVYNNVPIEIKEARKNLFSYENQGNNLYVYYDINLISEIANKTNVLWFKSADEFSDKEENAVWQAKFFNVLIYLQEKNCSEYNDEFKKIVVDAFKAYDIKKYYKRYYICCLSYEPDNNLCWYTFSGKKFQNINKIEIEGKYKIEDEISKEKIILTGDKLSCTLEKKYTHSACICFNKSALDCIVEGIHNIKSGFVSYSSKVLKKKFCACLDVIYDKYKENNNLETIKVDIYNLIDYCNLFFKNDYYAGEKEYRYIYDSSLPLDKTRLIKCDNNKEKPIITKDNNKGKTIYKLNFGNKSIQHITITNSNDKILFEEKYNENIFLSKISFNEESIKWFETGMLYED